MGEICKRDFLSKFPFQLLCSQELSNILWTCAALDMQSGVPNTSGALNRALPAPYQVGILLCGGCLCVPWELTAAAFWVTTEKSKNVEAKVFMFLRASVHYAFFFLLSDQFHPQGCACRLTNCTVQLTWTFDWNSSVLDCTSNYPNWITLGMLSWQTSTWD